MSKLNDIATELFKKLIDGKDKYLVNCSNITLQYKICGMRYFIQMKRAKYEEAKPMQFGVDSGVYCIGGIPLTPPLNYDKDPVIFRVCTATNVYDVNPMSRLDTALYLDKIDNIIKNWEESQLQNAIDVVTNNNYTPANDDIDDFIE